MNLVGPFFFFAEGFSCLTSMSWTHKQPIRGVNAATALDLKSTIIELVDARKEGKTSASHHRSRRDDDALLTLKSNAGVSKRSRADEEEEARGIADAREALEGKAKRYEDLMRGAEGNHDDGGSLVDFDRKAWKGELNPEEPDLLTIIAGAAKQSNNSSNTNKKNTKASVRHLQLQQKRDANRSARLMVIQRHLQGQSSALASALMTQDDADDDDDHE